MKKTIGIIGGGQLARMMVIAAKQLGFKVAVLDPTFESPAGQIADGQIVGDFTDAGQIRKLAEVSDYVTFDIEMTNADVLLELHNTGLNVHPSPKTLTIIKDKLQQKKFLRSFGLPVAAFIEIKTKNDVIKAGKILGYPFLLKARMDAYDGRGNARIENLKDGIKAIGTLKGRKLYAEKHVPFVKELAVIAARDTAGNMRIFPVVETIHRNHICHTVIAPAPVDNSVKLKAEDLARKTMIHLLGAGVFGIEMFLTKDGEVLINEIAPRVHNSGHYTIEACKTSQFEQHIRAITGMPLGETNMIVPSAVMVNILGDRSGSVKTQMYKNSLPGVSVHVYGKKDVRPERKMGHITAVGNTFEETWEKAMKMREMITI